MNEEHWHTNNHHPLYLRPITTLKTIFVFLFVITSIYSREILFLKQKPIIRIFFVFFVVEYHWFLIYFDTFYQKLGNSRVFRGGGIIPHFLGGGEEVLPDLSLLQVARKFPDGEKTAHLTSFSCPSSVTVHSQLPPFRFQTAIVPETETYLDKSDADFLIF